MNHGSRKTIIIYIGAIAALAVFAIAYFSSYFAVGRVKYASEFDLLPTEQENSESGFELIDVTESAVSNGLEDEDIAVSPIGIGKIPSLADANKGELEIYGVLQKNDGPISEDEKERLTENIHWQEYITGPDETLSQISRDFGVPVSTVRKANCFSEDTERVLEGTVLFIPDSAADIAITKNHVAKIRAESAKITREKNRMHPLLYIVQKGDTAAKIARRFGLKEATLLSANKKKTVRAGAHFVIPTMNGIYVVVEKKETLMSLAKRYKSSPASIMRANALENSKGVYAGRRLFIPGGRVPEERVAVVSRGFRGRIRMVVSGGGAFVGRFRWPCGGRMTSSFGYRRSPFRRRRSVFHAGIDIAAPRGTPIVAAADGVVVHSGWKSGYGKTIIIQHGGGVSTLYGHNSALLVGVGRTVSRGQIIARMGSTGRSTGNHCHFEVRRGGCPTNPMRSLR